MGGKRIILYLLVLGAGFFSCASKTIDKNTCLFVDVSDSMGASSVKDYLAFQLFRELMANGDFRKVKEKSISFRLMKFSITCDSDLSRVQGIGLHGSKDKPWRGLIQNLATELGATLPETYLYFKDRSTYDFRTLKKPEIGFDWGRFPTAFDDTNGCMIKAIKKGACSHKILYTNLCPNSYGHIKKLFTRIINPGTNLKNCNRLPPVHRGPFRVGS